MICQQCKKRAEHLIGLGAGFTKNDKPMIKVCERCRNDWIRCLDSEVTKLIKQQNLSGTTLFGDLGKKTKKRLWLSTFRKWAKMEFVFR